MTEPRHISELLPEAVIDYCPETTAIFDALWDRRVALVDAQLDRIGRTAFWLGQQMARHEITRSDVNRRIDAMTRQVPLDDDAWVPPPLAEEVALEALLRGMERGEAGA